ncbi:MAG TPA: hypothetical protein VF406_06625 [Thermodesulfobacteriota bacterium]
MRLLSDEFVPVPQTEKQRRVEARLEDLGGRLARHQGLTRRRFLGTASGMAAAFVASGYRFAGGGRVEDAWAQFERTGRIEWVTDLGQISAQTTVADPRVCAAMLGQLVRGLGADRIIWGTDAVWTGSPQWQIEALRRLEIPGDMRKRYGFAPLGAADGPVKRAIFGENGARLYRYRRRADLETDRVTAMKKAYEEQGPARSNLRYGYVVRG